MLPHDVPAPEARELRACALAALAEAGIVYLPLHLVLTESRGLSFDLETFALPFVLAYVTAAVLACRFRASRQLATTGVVAAVLAGIAIGHGDLNTTAFGLVVALLVGFRATTLGLRDWRTPLHGEIAAFAIVLGLEAVIGSGPNPEWRPLLVVVVPLFFVASLASRASTVWTSGGVHDLDEHVRASWIRRAVLATIALVGVMATAVILSIRGGAFDRLGQALTPAANAFATFVGWSLGQVARPIFWLVDLLGIDPQAVRDFFARLRRAGLGDQAREQLAKPQAALWQRLLGFAVFLLIGFVIYRTIRRLRPPTIVDERPSRAIATETAVLEDPVVATPQAFRSELPADAVRRWYAESLIALDTKQVAKAPALTPAEYVSDVARAYPVGAADFRALTGAYEDVRYGNLRIEADALRVLERRAHTFLEIVKRTDPEPPLGSPGDADDGEPPGIAPPSDDSGPFL